MPIQHCTISQTLEWDRVHLPICPMPHRFSHDTFSAATPKKPSSQGCNIITVSVARSNVATVNYLDLTVHIVCNRPHIYPRIFSSRWSHVSPVSVLQRSRIPCLEAGNCSLLLCQTTYRFLRVRLCLLWFSLPEMSRISIWRANIGLSGYSSSEISLWTR